jgi:8-oxo-dGTP pyrophosphatase MutT (NUDIX family)
MENLLGFLMSNSTFQSTNAQTLEPTLSAVQQRILRVTANMPKVKFYYRVLESGERIPPPEEVSAVFLIALRDNAIVAIRNHRGWDLPAGHLENREGIIEALQREAREEASMTFSNPIPFVIVTSDSQEQKYEGKCMIGFVTKEFTLNAFIPAPDSIERRVKPIGEFLSLYEQDKVAMKFMIERAQTFLNN